MFPKQAERRIASNDKPLAFEEFNDYYKAERENLGKEPPAGDTNAERSFVVGKKTKKKKPIKRENQQRKTHQKKNCF